MIMPRRNEIKKLVLFVVNSFWTTDGDALASTISLVMDKEDKTIEYAALMIVNDTDNASQFRVTAAYLAKTSLQDMAFVVPWVPPK